MIPADSSDLRARILGLAEEVASSAGPEVFVVDVEVRGQKGSRVLEVYVDADGGIGIDQLTSVSRELGFLLETEDVVAGRYHLNVSSPGANRPLRLPRQYHQHVGRPLEVTTGEGQAQQTRTGTLTAVHEEAFDLAVDGASESIPFSEVTSARVRLPW